MATESALQLCSLYPNPRKRYSMSIICFSEHFGLFMLQTLSSTKTRAIAQSTLIRNDNKLGKTPWIAIVFYKLFLPTETFLRTITPMQRPPVLYRDFQLIDEHSIVIEQKKILARQSYCRYFSILFFLTIPKYFTISLF